MHQRRCSSQREAAKVWSTPYTADCGARVFGWKGRGCVVEHCLPHIAQGLLDRCGEASLPAAVQHPRPHTRKLAPPTGPAHLGRLPSVNHVSAGSGPDSNLRIAANCIRTRCSKRSASWGAVVAPGVVGLGMSTHCVNVAPCRLRPTSRRACLPASDMAADIPDSLPMELTLSWRDNPPPPPMVCVSEEFPGDDGR